MFVHRSDLNKFGHLPTAFIQLFSTVLVERHEGGAPSEGLQPKVLSFELIPFETGCPIMDHSRPLGRAAWGLPSSQYGRIRVPSARKAAGKVTAAAARASREFNVSG